MQDLGIAEGAETGGGRRAVLIAGPTASGKSALALALAEELEGTIINADSMQVYDGLRILSARPTPEEEARAPHRLYGHVPPSERYTVARWLADATVAIAAARAEERVPIVVGGTGLYFKALTEGIAAVPPIPDELRTRLAAEAAESGIPALHARLALLDAEAATRLSPNDTTRVLRALEVIEATGRPLADWQRDAGSPPVIDLAEARAIVLEPDRAELYARIDRRFDLMVATGALEETRALIARGLDPSLPAMKAIGIREFSAYLEGTLSLEDAIARAKMESRRYAKRQGTWFRNQMGGWGRGG
ncbi:tRNA (adenosine(37)-N6)-dimethylallyltransferase MiaA [Kaistia geumhonensis]|uniref:tRNA dimethylallyltransferase n=1 Tax=Kaistia geumhonensis TaxID=410839 RepID=A0ABU0MC16_9HYPH|nr:tRNA (adenosine(37)-N6)-dimethylallyltransferase MiaA [Kaistia geumhonensis]MCX5481447.1 tRNA (adenosine(37)-N6)-dimethylallyltransferase MiaA [Kaistia geumhonensis]MDQ0518512.1 tRNA dimethylallyltransferase [Kaistia geumhonensis]